MRALLLVLLATLCSAADSGLGPPPATTAAVTGGTIDGAVIGGTTPAAGTFTFVNVPRVGSGTANGSNWGFGFFLANNSDSVLFGETSTNYLTGGGITGWTNDNPCFYVPSGHAFRMAVGTGAANYYDFSATAFKCFGEDVLISAAGKGIQIKEGSNARMGTTVAMVSGSTVVSNTSVTASTRFSLTPHGSTIAAVGISAVSAGVSFTIKSSSGADTNTVDWVMLEPAP